MADLGNLIRERRKALGLSLSVLSERAGCARSYLCEIERGRRGAPSDALLDRIEKGLEMESGALHDIAGWGRVPPGVKREVVQMRSECDAARRLATILRGSESLDQSWQSGELQRLIDRIDPEGNVESVVLAREIPLINRVAAGYPTEFTDLGYPARVADEYVRVPELADPDAFAARVVGDSMEPEYHEGDVVVFSPARSVRDASDCFARLEPDHETTFKRVYFETDEAGRELIRLQPLNSAYAPRVLDRTLVAGLYAAAHVVRSVP